MKDNFLTTFSNANMELPKLKSKTKKSEQTRTTPAFRSATVLGIRTGEERQFSHFRTRPETEKSFEFYSEWKDAFDRGKMRFDLYKRDKDNSKVKDWIDSQKRTPAVAELESPKYFYSDAVKNRLGEMSPSPLFVDVGFQDTGSSRSRDTQSRGGVRTNRTMNVLARSPSISYSARQNRTPRQSISSPISGAANAIYVNAFKSEICNTDPVTGDVVVHVDGPTIEGIECPDAERPSVLCIVLSTLKNVCQLTISQFKLGTSGAENLGAALLRFPSLTNLELRNCNLLPPGATGIARGLVQMSLLASLDLEENEIGPKGLKAVVDALCANSSITHINFAKNAIACEGVAHFATNLISDTRLGNDIRTGCGRQLASLILGSNDIGPKGCGALCDSLWQFCGPNMTHLDLSNNPLTACGNEFEPMASLSNALKSMTALCTLNLANAELYPEGGRLVIEGLIHKEKDLRMQIFAMVRRAGEEKKNVEGELARLEHELNLYQSERPLQNLNLDGNLISIENLNVLGDYRCLLKSLRTFNLACNDLTGNMYNPTFDGISGFSYGLKSARFLEVLILSDNRMSSEDGTQSCFATICESMLQLQNLTHLDLSRNNLGLKDIQRFASVLGRLGRLAILNLRSNRLGSDGLKSLAPALKRTLTDIDLSNNNIGPDGITALAMRLSEITGVTHLDLSRNHFSAVLGDLLDRHNEQSPLYGGAKSSVKMNKYKFSAIFRTVASKMSEAGSEVRKAALFGNSYLRTDAIQRGFPLFARRCAEHLSQVRTIVLGLPLDACRIRGVEPGASGPPGLQELALDYSNCKFGKEDIVLFFELLKLNTSLTSLCFAGNELSDQYGTDSIRADYLADWLSQASQLTRLDLTNSRLHISGVHLIAGGLEKATNLRELRLQGNFISKTGFDELSRSICRLSLLTYLDLSRNMLTSDGEFENKINSLRGPDFKDLAFSMDALRACESLQVLDLQRCSLRDEGAIVVAAVLQHLTGLLHLYIADNDIGVEGQEEIAISLHSCTQIQSTDGIKAPGFLVKEWRLKGQINFAYQLSFVASCIRRHPLACLDLSNNRLGRFSASFLALASTLASTTSITELDLEENGPCSERFCLVLARSLCALTALQVLKLSNNSIAGEGAAAIMCAVIRLRELRVLDVQHNGFHFAPCALSECCPHLHRLEVAHNPWLAPTQRVMERKNFREIKEGLQGLYGEGEPEFGRDLVLGVVGEEEVGKSSLVGALTSPANRFTGHHAAPLPACGLEIKPWHPCGQEGPQFTIYDFCGLAVYRKVQESLFFPRRGLYCVVWRPFTPLKDFEYADKEDGALPPHSQSEPLYRVRGHGLCVQEDLRPFLERQVLPWIRTLQDRLPGCHIVLVATHADEVPLESLQWQCEAVEISVRHALASLAMDRSRRPPRVVGSGYSLRVGSHSGVGIPELREALTSCAASLPFYGELIPRSWARAIGALRAEAAKSVIVPPPAGPARKEGQRMSESAIGGGGGGGGGEQPHTAGVGTGHDAPTAHEAPPSTAADGDKKRGFGEKGFMRMVYFKKLLKDREVEECHTLPILRYCHDSGWVRFYGFDDGANTGLNVAQDVDGFEQVDAYRSTSDKIATNPFCALRSKVAPDGVRDKDWVNIFDTIVLDLRWFMELTGTFVFHDAAAAVSAIRDAHNDLHIEAMRFLETGTLLWRRGWPGLLSHQWARFMAESDFRTMRNLFVANFVLEYSAQKNQLLVPCVVETRGAAGRGFYISHDAEYNRLQKRDMELQPYIRVISFLTEHIKEGSTVVSSLDMPEADLEKAVAGCSFFIAVLTDSYFDSTRCKVEFQAAADLGLEIVPVITADLPSWPPNSEGVWLASRNMTFWPPMCDTHPFDLSLAEFVEILDYFRDEHSMYGGVCAEPQSDPLFLYLLDLTVMEVQSFSNVQIEYWLGAYRRFQVQMKDFFLRLTTQFCRQPMFAINTEIRRPDLHHLRNLAISWQGSKDRASRIKIQVEELQNRIDRSGPAGSASKESSDEASLKRIREHLSGRDPWHAKLQALKEVANIHKGLQTSPLWHLRDAVMEGLGKSGDGQG